MLPLQEGQSALIELRPQMPIHPHPLPPPSEVEAQALEVERRVAEVDGAVVVRAEEGEVGELVEASPAQPGEVVTLADVGSVDVAGGPEADLTTTFVEVPQLTDQRRVAPRNGLVEIPGTLLGDAGGLVGEQALHRFGISQEEQGLQSLLGQQPGPRLQRQVAGEVRQDLMVVPCDPAHGGMALEGATQGIGLGTDRQPPDHRLDIRLPLDLEVAGPPQVSPETVSAVAEAPGVEGLRPDHQLGGQGVAAGLRTCEGPEAVPDPDVVQPGIALVQVVSRAEIEVAPVVVASPVVQQGHPENCARGSGSARSAFLERSFR